MIYLNANRVDAVKPIEVDNKARFFEFICHGELFKFFLFEALIESVGVAFLFLTFYKKFN